MKQQNQQRKILFIRHAQSTRNLQKLQVQDELSEQEYKKGKYDPQHFDNSITQLGIKQSENTAQIMKQLDIKIVLVSPLRRALQTCDIIFKNHPSKPRIIVQPLLTEKIHSASNFGTRLQQSMKMFPYFDFSKVQTKTTHWYIQLLNQMKKQHWLNIIRKQNALTGQQVGKLILKNIQNIKDFENIQDAKNRTSKIIDLLSQYENTHKNKVVFVGHSKITKMMCNIDQSNQIISFANSSVFNYNLDQNKMQAFGHSQ